MTFWTGILLLATGLAIGILIMNLIRLIQERFSNYLIIGKLENYYIHDTSTEEMEGSEIILAQPQSEEDTLIDIYLFFNPKDPTNLITKLQIKGDK
jgi:hypothetical protein